MYPMEVFIFSKSHDRFLIIDNKILYHIGASLKDLGKKWFAFSRVDLDINEMERQLAVGGKKACWERSDSIPRTRERRKA